MHASVQSLLTQTALCRELRLTQPDYIQALRDEREKFRHLFMAWVATLTGTDHYDDGWDCLSFRHLSS